MRALRVWVRRNGDFCQVRVDRSQDARKLLGFLSQSFVFKTFDPMREEESYCSFLVPYNPPLSHALFVKLLMAIPEVRLMSEPA